jgi:hypothetical protein
MTSPTLPDIEARANRIYGWYDDANQARDKPTYDPPHDAPCLFCGRAITANDVRTHSFIFVGQYAARCYFYRTHRTCDEACGSATAMDGLVMDMVKRNGD